MGNTMNHDKAYKYLEIAEAVAKLSKDASTKVGAVKAAVKKFDIDPLHGLVKYKDGKIAGSLSGAGYLRVKAGSVDIYVHRLIWFYVHGYLPEYIDHIDGNKRNNRIENLRSVTHAENHQNKGPQSNCWSGVPGVTFDFRKAKWVARIKTNGKTKFIGQFNRKQYAVDARKAVEKELHPFRRTA